MVSSEFIGPYRCGGIGTFYSNLGETLSSAGHEVTFLFIREKRETGSPEFWANHYRKKGIRFEVLPPAPYSIAAPYHQALSYRVWEWLKNRQFDIIHFPEYTAPGYYSVLAKKQGLAFSRTLLCVGTHSPTLWCRFANNEYLRSGEDLEIDFMERESVALADVVFSPSQYILNWMLQNGWRLPEKTYVQPYIVRTPSGLIQKKHSLGPRPIKELVFFGRLEGRKGITLFCDALDRLAGEGINNIKVTFLGRHSTVQGRPSAQYLSYRMDRFPWNCEIIDSLDQPEALQYLQQEGVLAVICSPADNSPNTVYESLALGIPFLACLSGGIPEIIDKKDHKEVCFPYDADSLAAKLKVALKNGIRPAMPAMDMKDNITSWASWHEERAIEALEDIFTAGSAEEYPLVSVCIVHYNRPEYLKLALASIEAQDYPSFEVILVDDGSTQPKAINYLNELQPVFEKRGWLIVRQQNSYLGTARNNAVEHARGDYVLIMDDDNIAKPYEISTFVKVALRTGADILTCPNDRFTGRGTPDPGQIAKEIWLPIGGAVVPSILRNCYGDANALVRREVFKAVGGYYTQRHAGGYEDWQFFAKAALMGFRLELVPMTLYWYRAHHNAMLRTMNQYAGDQMIAYAYMSRLPEPLRDMIPMAVGLSRNIDELRNQKDYYEERQALRELIIRATVLKELGQCWEAVAILQGLIGRLRKWRNPHVSLETLLDVGNLLIQLGESGSALMALRNAQEKAVTIQDVVMTERIGDLMSKLIGKDKSQFPTAPLRKARPFTQRAVL